MDWIKQDFWFPCYVADDHANDVYLVISKLSWGGRKEKWYFGIYPMDWNNITFQPNPNRDATGRRVDLGYVGTSDTLKSAIARLDHKYDPSKIKREKS